MREREMLTGRKGYIGRIEEGIERERHKEIKKT